MRAVGVAGFQLAEHVARATRSPTSTRTLPDHVRVAGEDVVGEPEDDDVAIGDLGADPGSRRRRSPVFRRPPPRPSRSLPPAGTLRSWGCWRSSPGPRTPGGIDRRGDSSRCEALVVDEPPVDRLHRAAVRTDDRRPAWSLERRRDPSGGPGGRGRVRPYSRLVDGTAGPARSRPWSWTIRFGSRPGSATVRSRKANAADEGGRVVSVVDGEPTGEIASRSASPVSSTSTPPPPRRTSIDWIVALTGKPLIRRRSYWTCTRPSTPRPARRRDDVLDHGRKVLCPDAPRRRPSRHPQR